MPPGKKKPDVFCCCAGLEESSAEETSTTGLRTVPAVDYFPRRVAFQVATTKKTNITQKELQIEALRKELLELLGYAAYCRA